jgi:hypothetical protein
MSLTLMALLAGLMAVGYGVNQPGMFVSWQRPNQPIPSEVLVVLRGLQRRFGDRINWVEGIGNL